MAKKTGGRKKTASSRSGQKKAPKATLDASMRVAALCGDDDFLLQEITDRFAQTLEETYGGLERFRFDGREAELSDVLDELRSFGLIQRHKLVILDHADTFLTNEGYRPAMERYIEHPVEDATLLLRFDSFKSNAKIEKSLLSRNVVHSCETPTSARAVSWCIGRCEKRFDATITRDAAELLVERLGPGLARLDSELRKLSNFVGKGQTIDRDAVVEMVGASREEKVWELQTAMLTGRAEQALAKLQELLHISRHPEELVRWSLADLARKLHAVRQAMDSGSNMAQVAGILKIFGPQRTMIGNAARAADSEQFAQLLRECVEADARVKQGRADSVRSLEVMTVRMTDMIRCDPPR